MTDIAFMLIMPIVFGFLIGHYLDGISSLKFPLWTIIFVILGVLTGMWSVYKRYIR